MRENIQSVTYSDGGLQHPASIGVSFADLYCLSVCNEQKRKSKLPVKYVKVKKKFHRSTRWNTFFNKFKSEPYIFSTDYCSLQISQDNSSSASSYECYSAETGGSNNQY